VIGVAKVHYITSVNDVLHQIIACFYNYQSTFNVNILCLADDHGTVG
jgi:hypothetical protein